MSLYYQIHRYKNGHQLVAGTAQLDRPDQDTVDRLSDISGQLRPGELFDPYYSCYPSPTKKYFIVAKTWQDLTAPRAGCVLTKSVIVSMETWAHNKNIAAIFSGLQNADFDLSFPVINLEADLAPLAPVSDAPLDELIEALFLEQRKPILVFDSHEQLTIIERLYTVFWPSIRKEFAACTFSLSPRSINNRPFDLLFTIGNMRPRFSDWNGRRIDGATNNRKGARHRWTKDIADRIFKDANPTLYNKNEFSLLGSTETSDESTLRLSWLWDELLVKAKYESSPMAILGLLDIINSQQVFTEALYGKLDPYIRRAVKDAMNTLEIADAWRFYAALLVKHKRKLMGREMLLEVKSACIFLTLKNPEKAITFILNFNPSLERIPSVLYAGIGDGLAQYFYTHTISLLNQVPSSLGLLLLATSAEFAATLMTLLQKNKTELNGFIKECLQSPDMKEVRRAKSNLLPYIKTSTHRDVVYSLFHGASISEQQKILKTIGENTIFNFREFDNIILQSVFKNQLTGYLLDLIISYNKNSQADGLMVKLLEEKIELIEVVLSDPRENVAHYSKILVDVFNIANGKTLEKIARNNEVTLELLPILSNNKKTNKGRLAELIVEANISVSSGLTYFNKLTPAIINGIDINKLIPFLEKSINTAKPAKLLLDILKKLEVIQADRLTESLFSNNTVNANSSEIFDTLFNAGGNLKNSLTKYIGEISEVLSKTLPVHATTGFIERWTNMVKSTNDVDEQRKAAIHMLGYAFKRTEDDPTLLIITAFPIVYDTFSSGRTFAQSIAYWVFSDWDKCKTLRFDLVDRYLQSNWPPLGLFQVAKKTGIIKEIISILNNSKTGRKYMESLLDELDGSSIPFDKGVVKQIKKNVKTK